MEVFDSSKDLPLLRLVVKSKVLSKEVKNETVLYGVFANR